MMTRLKTWARRYVRQQLCRDFHAAVVGTIVGAIVGYLAAAMAASEPKEIFVFTNDAGFAQPIPSLIRAMAEEKESTDIDFDPPELTRTFVCEFAYITGPSGRAMMFDYLDRYSMCFDVRQKSENSFEISADTRDGTMQQRGDEWFCRCNL